MNHTSQSGKQKDETIEEFWDRLENTFQQHLDVKEGADGTASFHLILLGVKPKIGDLI